MDEGRITAPVAGTPQGGVILAAALQHLPARARHRVDAPIRASWRAGALRGRLRGDVRHGGRVRAPSSASATCSRGLAWNDTRRRRGASTSREGPRASISAVTYATHERTHLTRRHQRVYYSPAMAISARDATGAPACEGCHVPCRMPSRPARDPRAAQPDAPGAGAYFRTGNAANKFGQVDDYVHWRLKRVLMKRHGRQLHPGQADHWTPDFFYALGLHRLRGTIRYPDVA